MFQLALHLRFGCRTTTEPNQGHYQCVFVSLTDQGQKSSNSGLKRTLSEGNENDAVTVKREGKRPKVEHEELEAQLELKITAKAGSQQKLEKVCFLHLLGWQKDFSCS